METTYFAPAERTIPEVLIEQMKSVDDAGSVISILDAVPYDVLILNKEREIVWANKTLTKHLGIENDFFKRGVRPGELFNCIHMNENSAGCGTTEHCRTCGAVLTILEAQTGKEAVNECRMTQKETLNALDLRVSGSPFRHNDEDFVIFTITDISSEKRKEALERIFFHDILNTAGGILGFASLIQISENDELKEFTQQIDRLSRRLIDEIKAQRLLSYAERGDYEISKTNFDIIDLVNEIASGYRQIPIGSDKIIENHCQIRELQIFSDKTLIERVFTNMIKNALEASDSGQTIKYTVKADGPNIVLSVNNPRVMPKHVQLQVFKRSFSTKGRGRGLGTFSIKLLTERYLGGEVWFTTDLTNGTTFFAKIPVT